MKNWQIWLRYFLVWPGLPEIGNPNQADCVIVQAFGRNSYADNELWRVAIRKVEENSDWQLVQELLQEDFKSGQPNYVLAWECQELVDKFDIPAVVQWEIACAFEPHWYAVNQHRVFVLWPPVIGYFGTIHVKRATLDVCRQHGWSRVIEVAHKRMIVRATLIVRKLWNGQMPIILLQQTNSFDSESVQIWTRNPVFWLIREGLGRIHHLIRKYV